MPSCGGPVYQPTTVSYEPRSSAGAGNSGGGAGLGLLGTATSLDSPFRLFRKRRPQLCLLFFGLTALAAGITLLTSGITDWMDNKEIKTINDEEVESVETVTSHNEAPVCILLAGTFLSLFGIIALALYIKFADWRRNCNCPCSIFNKKQSMARQFQCQNVGGCGGQGIMALNPSTDPLVSHTQYAPVSELPRPDDEERHNLMHDNKDCLSSAEESDRMLEPDPRILLRPMGHVEDA